MTDDHSVPDIQRLRNEARRARRLAAGVTPGDVHAVLLEYGRQCEAAARRLASEGRGPEPCEDAGGS